MKSANLLVEIGVEELPAIPLLKILNKIEKSWGEILKEYRLESEYQFDYTPRRLVLRSNNFPTMQADKSIEMFGPPLKIALNSGEPTQAALGFARKCGVAFEDLTTTIKGKNEVLYFKKVELGQPSSALLEEMLHKWLKSMEFGKMMRWGSYSEEFIRPVRWIVVLLNDAVVDATLFSIKSSNISHMHRFGKKPQAEVTFGEYEQSLKENSVILSAKSREEMVVGGIRELEKSNSVEVELDSELLSEVVAITEHPTPLLGSFDEKFLELPPEVIITSMKEHQRYFAVFKDGKLTNKFVVVSNAVTDDFSKIIAGNERVLRPRLEDALFFYHNDLKRGLKTDGLELVQFIDGLGTLKDKIEREKAIVQVLFYEYKEALNEAFGESRAKELLIRAVDLAKADLMSEMVYEFTELQGLMGYYYAKALNEDPLVATAIKEQYMPVGDNAPLPSNLLSALVAMAIKLDTLYGLFSVGKIPTGSKDPFALRRAVNGIIKTLLAYDLDFDIERVSKALAPLYKEFDLLQIKQFIFDRINKIAGVNPSIVSAVLSSGDTNINTIFKKIDALNRVVGSSESQEIFTTFKRVANISKEVDMQSRLTVNESLFELEDEHKLYGAYKDVISKEYANYLEHLQALFGLKPLLDSYFDNVLVNAENADIRKNRQNMIALVYKAFKDIADIKEITV